MSDQFNAFSFGSKDTLLGLVRREAGNLISMASESGQWEAPTACSNWQVRDQVGHMIDATEGYFPGFELARANQESTDTPIGLRAMAARLDERARSHRALSRGEALDRLQSDLNQAMNIYEGLSEADWMGMQVFHAYAGPLPAAFYPWFQLVDYGVHSWDIREGRGEGHGLAGDVADMLAPLALIVWQITAMTDNVAEPFSIGINNSSGANAGTFRMNVSKEGLTYEPGPVDDLPAVIDFDPASLVLTSYGRMRGGTTRGDAEVADRFRSLFFEI
ncbi:MAG TPA: maleylpyruvate isomerase family mycothiol-dependent enzyme [Sporichthyaceae bacterium]|nr:maleylpyruvate isomerase family mycothiol-dependent enzyme [Sporichthyaceae bacterium]